MSNVNVFVCTGNLTKEPRVFTTKHGKGIEIRIAINRTYKVNGQPQEEVCYLNAISYFEQRVNFIETYCTKGKSVAIQGRLVMEEWADPNNDNKKRQSYHIMMDQIQLLGSKDDGGTEPVTVSAPELKSEDFGSLDSL